MKKTIFLWLLILAAFYAIGQGKTLYEVNVVKPKAGMRSAFEASWKAHLDQYHKTSDKRNVYEVTSGPHQGSYVIVEGPLSYSDMDNPKPNSKGHILDLDKNISPKLEPGNQNFIARLVDTLSHNGSANGEKLLVTVTVIKNGRMADYVTEVRRSAIISGKLNSPLSYNILIKQQAGTSPTIITLRDLKNGYKEMEANYFNLPQNQFRDAYIKEYGQEAWDKRQKLIVDDVASRELNFEVRRPDLSSPQ